MGRTDLVLKKNTKKLPNPSFFMISNLGGGGSDKYRETVYLDLFGNIPKLYNYYYLRTQGFAGKWLRKIDNFDTFADFINYTRESMIKDESYYSKSHDFKPYDANDQVILLDSGAANLINDILKDLDIKNNYQEFLSKILKVMFEYYDFAARYKFDMVISFDTGGKYTFKGDERHNKQIIEGNKYVEEISNDLNKLFLIETIKYLKKNKNFYPKVYATIHGNTPNEYLNYTKFILDTEKEMDYKFQGFALGGVASSKNIPKEEWGINNNEIKKIDIISKNTVGKSEIYNSIITSYATRIVRSLIQDRPIHVLGGGGKLNIIPLFFSGANSFDCQTPGRRAYDGNDNSTKHVFDNSYNDSFSMYLIGLINNKGKVINAGTDEFKYMDLNKVDSNVETCGCISCSISSIDKIKQLYSNKSKSNEDYYYSRQLINAHGIWQHQYLCDILKNVNNFDELYDLLSPTYAIKDVLKYIVKEFSYNI